MFVVNEIRSTQTHKQDITTLIFRLNYKVIIRILNDIYKSVINI